MPEPPDFDQIALRIVERIWSNTEIDQPGLIIETHAVADQLRQVWNARGAADADAAEHRVSDLVSHDLVGRVIARDIAEAIQKVDCPVARGCDTGTRVYSVGGPVTFAPHED